MIIEIIKIKSILIKHNALDSFIHNSGAPEKEKRAMTNHFGWYCTSQGEYFWHQINCELRDINLHNFPFSTADLKTPIKVKTIKE